MYDLYEMFESMLQEERNELTKEEYKKQRSVFKEAKRIGDQIGTRIFQTKHLEELPSRIENNVPRNEIEYRCLQISKTVLLLMTQHPDANLMQNMCHQEYDDYDEGWVGADVIFSFVYANDDDLSEKVLSLISEEYGNCGNADQATCYTVYNKHIHEPTGLEYEIKLIALIEELIHLLNILE